VSPLVIIFVTVFIDLLGFGIIIPLLPFYAEHFGASALAIGLLSTSFSVAQFLFAPFWGRLSDRIGRRPVILMGLLGSAVSYSMFALADSLTMLFVARTLSGVAGANIPTAQAFVADVTGAEHRARGMGMIGAAFGLGFVFGPAIGGFTSRWGYAAPAWFAAALSAANFVAALIVLPESRAKDAGDLPPRASRFRSFQQALARPHLPLVLMVYFLVLTAFSSFESMFALYGEHRFALTPASIGYIFALVGAVLATIQGVLVGRVVRRWGERRVVPAAILVLSAALALVAVSNSVAMLTAACALLAVGMGFNGPSMMSLISQLADPRAQGGTLGVSQALASLARIVGPAWGGWVYDRFGHDVPFVTAAGLMLIACGMSVAAFGRVRATNPEALEST
jgi:MFS transporter, DHA1 family, tetracycline resistance protein